MRVGGSSSQTIGYRYFMGLHMAICHGPVDSVNQIYVGERSLEITPTAVNTTAFISQKDLFGGDKKEGGILGDLDIELGGGAQPVNSYLALQFGADTPAFRGVTCLVFRETSQTGFPNYTSDAGGGYIAAMSPYPKPWSVEVTDIPGGSLNPTKQNINGGANGGHIIFEAITDTDWGLGASNIDIPSFTAATDTLFAEDFSLSMIYAQQGKIETFIQEVLSHINGVVYTDRKTNEFVLKLIRDDYVPASLPVFDETNIVSLINFERPAYADLINEIVFTYRNQGAFTDSTITVQELAAIQAQGAIVSQTTSFAGIDNDALASTIAARELKQLSTPLARVKFSANREAWNTNPGDVIKVSWAALGIAQVILRVVDVNYGELDSGAVVIDAVEDIFGLPANSYIAPVGSGWVDEVSAPIAAPSARAIELPYFVAQTTFPVADLSELVNDTGIAQVVTENTANAAFNVVLKTRTGATAFEEVDNAPFAPTAILTGALDFTTKLAIPISNFKGGIGEIAVGSYAYLNGEALRVDSVDVGSGLMDIGRGYLDSIPQSHNASDIIYFADANSAIDPTVYATGETVDTKSLPQTSLGILPEGSAATESVAMTNRMASPYPAAQVQIAGSFFPAIVAIPTVVVTWAYQDRTQQLAIGGDDWFDITLGSPEAGVLYEVRYYNDDTSTLLFTDSGIDGTSSSHLVAGATGLNFNMRIEVEAIRDATISNHTTFVHIFDYTKPLQTRTLEGGDTRTLESGDTRIMEN